VAIRVGGQGYYVSVSTAVFDRGWFVNVMSNFNQPAIIQGGITMKISTLLLQRKTLLRQTHMANLAFAYLRLSEYAARIARARLTGDVSLKAAVPDAGHYWASLTALEGNQSVIEEHFADEEVMNLVDVLAFLTGDNDLDLTFRIEELSERFLTPLRYELKKAGVTIDGDAQTVVEPNES
jgi:hypothetical protein